MKYKFPSTKKVELKLNQIEIHSMMSTKKFFIRDFILFCLSQFEMFNELARIFSEDNNASAQRAVLWREGTAKVN